MISKENWMTEQIDFMNFVERVFFFRNRCPINRFYLSCSESQALDPLRLEGWIHVVTWHGIREPELDLFVAANLLLPTSLFPCKTLVILNSGPPSLKELRNLDSATRFSNDDSAESLLSNRLVLEHLDIHRKASDKIVLLFNIDAVDQEEEKTDFGW
ncbi:hypothetical protein SLA2020_121050 [Shorea laevis]